MKKTAFTLATLIGLSFAGGALAQDLDFATLDADGSGALTLEELQVAIPDLTAESFAMLDTDANGEISEEEFAALSAGGEAAPAPDAPAADEGAVEGM
ncbi:EF-hand domain-containing protein [Pelagibacterium lacus]|uniref:EF-hand domain-containing protein n=1 Tax=Pelagibacterium lacus TaxID=2282655 RepID=A0A369W8D2_9HYPH|nr:EF-hand domain-containing protein [Pelagibacterium lacus]RDE10307.1 EF-hand domain-containing protein [Pelagibacterium lacus]